MNITKMSKQTCKLEYEDLEFRHQLDKIRFVFLQKYYFMVTEKELGLIADFKVDKNSISFNCSENKARKAFNRILERGLMSLTSFNNRPTIYVYEGSGIPLIGTNIFGVVDRNTNVIEVKPLTGCNLNCIYCSVDEGVISKKTHDFLVQADYLVKEFKKVASLKNTKVEAHIGGQSEPTMHPHFLDIIKGLSAIDNVYEIAVDTNGISFNKEYLQQLKDAGLTRVNLSIDAIDPEIAKKMAGGPYNINHIKQVAKDTIAVGMKCLLAPVYCPGVNEDEIPKIIQFAKEIGAYVGIQNALPYAKGRNMKELLPLDDFFKLIKKWEEENDVDLSLKDVLYFEKDKTLEKPMKKNDVVKAEVVCPGKYPKEWIAKAHDRAILFYNDEEPNRMVKIKLLRDKHNIYTGVLA